MNWFKRTTLKSAREDRMLEAEKLATWHRIEAERLSDQIDRAEASQTHHLMLADLYKARFDTLAELVSR